MTSDTTFDDNFELAQAEGFGPNAPFENRILKLRLLQEFLRARRGLPCQIDYRVPYAAFPETIGADDDEDTMVRKKMANDAYAIGQDMNPSVFIPKYMTDMLIWFPDEKKIQELDSAHTLSDIPENASLKCRYQNLDVIYFGDVPRFSLSGFCGNIYELPAQQDEKYLNRVLFENIKGAMILAQNAKAAGWTSVNFGNTKDPAKRMALQTACEYFGLAVINERVDMSALPQNTFYKGKLQEMIEGSLMGYRESLAETIWPYIPPQKFEPYKASPQSSKTDVSDLDAAFGLTP